MDEIVESVSKSKTLTGEMTSVEQTAVALAREASRVIASSSIDVDRGQMRY